MSETRTRTIKLIPHYGNTTEWMAGSMAEHGFRVGSYDVMATILQNFGAIAIREPKTALMLIENLRRREQGKSRLALPDQDDSLYEKED